MAEKFSKGIYDCPVLSNTEVARGIFLMRLHAPEIAAGVQPGQFVNVTVNANGSDHIFPLLRRPFSVCQAHREAGWISILWKAIGPGTRLLTRRRPGNVLNLIGPLGKGYQLPQEKREVFLVGGGLGVAPLPLLAEAFHAHGISFEVMLGARTAAELWGHQEFQPRSGKIHLADGRAKTHLAIATDDGSAGHHGFVTEILAARLRKNPSGKSPAQIYACGPMPMLQRVAAICREAQAPAQIAVETMMGCGFGICMGCPVAPARGVAEFGRYLLACVDGPVFHADEICYESFAH